MSAHDRPARRESPIPPALIADRHDVVAAEYEARARWFRAKAVSWRAEAARQSAGAA